MSNLHSIDTENARYVLAAGDGFTCLGFAYAEARRAAVRRWLGLHAFYIKPGTVEHFADYESVMAQGAAHHAATGKRCDHELTAQLIGREGKRVEIRAPGEPPRRFYVGRSSGWFPCHLEIARRDSSGGPAVYMPEGATVRTVE